MALRCHCYCYCTCAFLTHSPIQAELLLLLSPDEKPRALQLITDLSGTNDELKVPPPPSTASWKSHFRS
jgi:hypothetical protein